MKTYTQEELKEIIRLHGFWLFGGTRANLSNSNLSYSNLSGSDLSNSNLSNSNLSNSDLSNSNLSNSDLSNSNLSNSNLSGSNLSYSNLSNSNLSYSNLSNSNLSGVTGFVYIGLRSDGYQFHAIYARDHWRIKAGCRDKTIEEYRIHTESYYCDIKRQETLDLLDFAEKRIRLLGRNSNDYTI